MKANKENIEALIDKLADKTLSFGCEIIGGDYDGIVLHKTIGGCYIYRKFYDSEDTICESLYLKSKDIIKILGHPIMIGDVLEKIYKEKEFAGKFLKHKLLDLWEKTDDLSKESSHNCFTKSFQQIIEESGWETRKEEIRTDIKLIKTLRIEQLKDPDTRALAEFLLDIFNK